jgi:hypothetical protein
MQFNLVRGIVAGLAAGVLLATMLTVMQQELVTGPVTLMGLVARDVGSKHLAVGWLLDLAVCAGLGALFGLAAGRSALDSGAVAVRALFFGLALWIVGGVLATPLLFGLSPLRGLSRVEVFPWLPALLVAWLLFVSVLAAVFVWLGQRRRPAARAASTPEIRRAA